MVADLESVALREPPVYHPNWGHEFVLEVTSLDGSQKDDCVLGTCNPIDPYATMLGGSESFGGTVAPFSPPFDGTTCSNESYVSLADGDACLQDWRVYDLHAPMQDQRHMGAFAIQDADTGGNDHLQVVDPGPDPMYGILWDLGRIELRSTDVVNEVDPLQYGLSTPPVSTLVIHNNDPLSHCLRVEDGDNVGVCVKMSWEESTL